MTWLCLQLWCRRPSLVLPGWAPCSSPARAGRRGKLHHRMSELRRLAYLSLQPAIGPADLCVVLPRDHTDRAAERHVLLLIWWESTSRPTGGDGPRTLERSVFELVGDVLTVPEQMLSLAARAADRRPSVLRRGRAGARRLCPGKARVVPLGARLLLLGSLRSAVIDTRSTRAEVETPSARPNLIIQ